MCIESRLRVQSPGFYMNGTIGAEEGTRTPTPLPVHGPEPCASANSATMASGRSSRQPESRRQEDLHPYSTEAKPTVKLGREELRIDAQPRFSQRSLRPSSAPSAF